MAAKRGKGWTLVIIPENETGARQIRLHRRSVYGLVIVFSLIVLYALVETALFLIVARKAAQVDPLKQQVRELQGSNNELARMGEELSKLREFQSQVRRVLGGTETGRSTQPEWLDNPPDESKASVASSIGVPGKPVFDNSQLGNFALSATDLPTEPPIRGYFTRGFHAGGHLLPVAHHGIDLAAKIGTTVVASADGIVVFSGWDYTLGNLVIVLHRSGYISHYGHNQSLLCRSGQRVRQGEPIALMGNSGASSAPHLHFEIWKDGIPVDPSLLIHNLP